MLVSLLLLLLLLVLLMLLLSSNFWFSFSSFAPFSPYPSCPYCLCLFGNIHTFPLHPFSVRILWDRKSHRLARVGCKQFLLYTGTTNARRGKIYRRNDWLHVQRARRRYSEIPFNRPQFGSAHSWIRRHVYNKRPNTKNHGYTLLRSPNLIKYRITSWTYYHFRYLYFH